MVVLTRAAVALAREPQYARKSFTETLAEVPTERRELLGGCEWSRAANNRSIEGSPVRNGCRGSRKLRRGQSAVDRPVQHHNFVHLILNVRTDPLR